MRLFALDVKLRASPKKIKPIRGLEITTQSSIENDKTKVTPHYAEMSEVVFGQHRIFFLIPNGFDYSLSTILKLRQHFYLEEKLDRRLFEFLIHL
jgi:hypothetical protein